MKKLLLGAAILTGISFFCLSQTKGFRMHLILSDLPNDPRWELPYTEKEIKEVKSLLDQPFTFIGRGGWCFAFLGADQKTILKFFKHEHLTLKEIASHFSFDKLLLKSQPTAKPYFQEFNFKSCMLLHEKAREHTGLIYLHLNKTDDLLPKKVTLYDAIGVCHTIDLNQTEFVLQERAELLFDHIQHLVDNHQEEKAKHAIDDILHCLLTLCKQGARDTDLSIKQNFGFANDKAITIDLSSFVPDEKLKSPSHYKKEVFFKSRRMSRWLQKHHPELSEYCEERLSQILDTGELQ